MTLFVATDQLCEGKRNLATVRDLIAGQAEAAGQSGMDVLAEQMRANNAADEFVRQAVIDAAEDFFSKPDDERGSVLSNTRRHLRFLSYPQIRENMSDHDFNLADLKTGIDGKPVSIYLCLPAMAHGHMQSMAAIVRQSGTRSKWNRCQSSPTRRFCSVLMSFRCSVTCRHLRMRQARSQDSVSAFGPLSKTLDNSKRSTKTVGKPFLGNSGVIQVFGLNDLESLEWVSKRLGTTSLIVRNKSEVSDRDATSTGRAGASWSLQTQPLMTIDEIARLFGRFDPLGRQLLIFSSFDPVILQRVNYDSHELFEGRFDASGF